jgi:hypothetical protein
MKFTMDMSNYEIECEVIEEEYGEEILSAGWNPDVESMNLQLQLVSTSDRSALPEGLATEAAELFLRKMYSYQR